MKNEPKFVAISNQKGGVGKSAMTVLLASYIHYVKNKSVLVVDCDFPQHSILTMRDREKDVIGRNEYLQQLLIIQSQQIQKKAYNIITANPELALNTANAHLANSGIEYDVIFFDLPGTVNTEGIFNSLINMDYIFTPIISDKMAMQSSISFATSLNDFQKKRPGQIPLNGLYLFWNMIDSRVSKEVYNMYNKIIHMLKLNVLQTIMPHTHRFNREISETGKVFFRSTLFPPPANAMQGSRLDELATEILSIIKL